jgi:hypothetical protein
MKPYASGLNRNEDSRKLISTHKIECQDGGVQTSRVVLAIHLQR